MAEHELLTPITILILVVLTLAATAVLGWAITRIHARSNRKRGLGAVRNSNTLEPVTNLIPDSSYADCNVSKGSNGTRIHYVQAGQGPDVVLLHGIGASLFIWRFLFPLLQKNYRVTALDLPGFGRSSKEAGRDYGLDAQAQCLVEALDQIGIQKASLVGSSMGGALALWMAKLYPERFERVATLAPATDSSLVPGHVKHFALAAPLIYKAMNRKTMKLFIGRVVANPALVTDEVIDAYLEPFRDDPSSIRAFLSSTSLLSDKRLPKDLSGMKSDVMILYGGRDLLVSRRSMERLKKVLPHASLFEKEDGGHHIMEDSPEWTTEKLEEFFSKGN